MAPADLVLRHGAVYTMDATRSWAEAIAIKHGRIVYVGSDHGASSWIGPDTRVLPLDGKMVLPGFHDSHVHPISGGLRSAECPLEGVSTEAELREALRLYAGQNPQKTWIRGRGWSLPAFSKRSLQKAVLDEVVPDRPVYLVSADGHTAWVNSLALELAEITSETVDPAGGFIDCDPVTNEPIGLLREDAMDLVADLIPEYSLEDHVLALRRALQIAAQYGITSLHDASVDEDILEAYAELDRRDQLTAKVVTAYEVDPARGPEQVERLVALRTQYHGRNFRLGAAKIFIDGVVEARSAALLEPYVGFPGESGRAKWDQATLDQLVTVLEQEGFQAHFHAVGDRAVRMSLDAIEAARRANGNRDLRHHIAHLQLIDQDDRVRFRRLGVIANFQPLWAQSDAYITELTEPVLGPERSRRLYPIASLGRTSAVVAFGSDWPVSSLDPLKGIQVAITRRAPIADPGPAWIPDERIDLPTALAGYTIHGVYVDAEERETGSIEVGKAADLAVLNCNLFEIPAHEIHHAHVVLTLMDGVITYRERPEPTD